METRINRYSDALGTHGSYRTYEEWKQTSVDALTTAIDEFLPYL